MPVRAWDLRVVVGATARFAPPIQRSQSAPFTRCQRSFSRRRMLSLSFRNAQHCPALVLAPPPQWGIYDGDTWVGTNNHPLLWDENFQTKPAFDSVLSTFQRHAAKLEAQRAAGAQ